MENYIQIQNDNYTVKISLENIDYKDISNILSQIKHINYKWENFYANDKFWYYDNSKVLMCLAVNHDAKVIIFG